MTPSTAPHTPAANAEQALSKLAFAVREIANLDRTEWSEDQLHRFRLLVSEADRLAGLIEGEHRAQSEAR